MSEIDGKNDLELVAAEPADLAGFADDVAKPQRDKAQQAYRPRDGRAYR